MSTVSVRATVLAMHEAEGSWAGVVEQLATWPEVVERLLAEHVAGSDGYCMARSCRRRGYGSPYVPAPCSMRRLGLAAREYQARGEAGA